MLTLARCESVMLHALGLSALPPELSTLELVDEAGQWLTQAYGWSWLNRRGTVSTSIGVEFVSLATLTGFKQLIGRPQYTNGWLEPSELSVIENLRAQTTSGITGYPSFCALSWQITTAGVLTPVLELFRTPSQVFTIRVPYKAGWQTPLDGSDQARIAVPAEIEPLFKHTLVQVAMAYQERDKAGVAERYAEIKVSPLFQDCVRVDSMRQPNFGQIHGGGVLNHGGEPQMETAIRINSVVSP